MFTELRPAITLFLAFTLLTGVAYPLAVTGVAQLVFPHQANGSLIYVAGELRGSELLGQTFDQPQYFWSRPSAVCYAGASSGSNLGPTNPALLANVDARVAALRAADADLKEIPVDLGTASGSGLDPHITPAAAEVQLARVAKARGLSVEAIRGLVRQHTEERTFGLLGEPRVNVLRLNLALDAAEKTPTAPASLPGG